MGIKKAYLLMLAVAIVSLTVIPAAAADMPDELSDYMARLALGKLYVPYYMAYPQQPPLAEEDVPPPVSEDSTAEESSSALPDLPPEGMIAVEAVNLCRYEAGDTPPLLMINETQYKTDLSTVSAESISGSGGAVLILHTHGTESYLPDGVDYYGEGDSFRSTDTERNVVAVGAEFAATLRKAGIEVFHDTTLYDEADFDNAYTASRNGAKEWLRKYPQICYIIDIHRDAVSRNGINCKPLCQTTKEPTAQVMLVIGTDEAGASHPNWAENLSLAASYQALLNRCPTLARPVYLRRASFNQQLSAGAMLLEVGSAANTLTEAKNAARIAAECFISLWKGE